MKIYCMSDIHGCLDAFNEALSLVEEHLHEPDTMLILLGDYIHGGHDNYGVLDRIIGLQEKYGTEKIIALMGNHEEFVNIGDSTINHMIKPYFEEKNDDDRYLKWMEYLPRYYSAGKTIFVHAGIDEDAGELWEWCTDECLFTGKFPAETGRIHGLDMRVVAGHVGTSDIARDKDFHDIYYDGASHIYIDGTVLKSGVIPVLLVDTDEDKYYRVTEAGNWPVLPYEKYD